MPNVNQMYSTINDINHQLWGDDVVDVHDLSGLISLGNQFSGDLIGADKFLGKLVDRIGKTVIRRLDVEIEYPSLLRNAYEFGCILQKITVNPMDAIRTSEWDVGEDGFTPTFANVSKHDDIHVTYFTDMDTFKFFTTIPDDLFFTAFTSESAMSNFIDAIIGAMNDSVVQSVNNLARTSVNNFIAEKIKANNGVINALTLYNEVFTSATLTAAEAMHNKEFARFLSQVIRNHIKYLSEPSSLYNTGGVDGAPIERTTQRDNMHIFFLTDLVSLFDAYLLSDSYKDLYNLPYYNEVAYWQGNNGGDAGINTFDVNSSINVIPSSEKDAETATPINQSGIVAVLADREAIAIGINKRRASSFRNDIDGYTNFATSITQQHINDLSENGIIIIVADESEADESEAGEAGEAGDGKSVTKSAKTDK